MKAILLDIWPRRRVGLAAPESAVASTSRRSIAAALVAAVLGAIASVRLDAANAAASRHRHRRDHAHSERRKKKKKKPQSPPPPPPTDTPSPPPPPPPLPTGPGFCGYDGSSTGLQGSRRWAQTLLPPRAGQLTKAAVGLRTNPPSFSLTFEVRSVDASGVPTGTILATAIVSNIPQTDDDPTIVRYVVATFASPATMVLGQPVALSITEPNGAYSVHVNKTGNVCKDGALFMDIEANNGFDLVFGGDADLIYTLTIV